MKDSNQNPMDISKENYIFIKKQFKNFGFEEIIDGFGQVIGKVSVSFFTLSKNITVQDLIVKKTMKIESKNSFFYKFLNIKDISGNLVAKIKKKKFSFTHSRLRFEKQIKNTDIVAVGNFKKSDYEILNSSDNQLIAYVKNNCKIKSVRQDLDFSSYNCLEIINNKIERILLICFIISINNFTSRFYRVSDLTGFERKIARLRPFGPGKSLN